MASGNSTLIAESDSETVLSPEDEAELRAKANRHSKRFVPPVPQSLADTGLPPSLIEQLILKFLYFKGDLMAGDLARSMGIRFSFIEHMIEALKGQQYIHVKSSLGLGRISSTLSLTELGRRITRDYLENNQYAGPAPVPINQYCLAVEAQQMPPNWLTLDRLRKAYAHMVVSEDILNQVGPAVSSGKSFLIYGQPGNGKTQLAEALSRIQTSDIYIPYAIECQGNIVQLFDPIYHEPSKPDAPSGSAPESDERWARCNRPFIATGGELALSMLDLSYNPVSKIYDAPFQLKANNGIYLIDDFGRQKATSAEILNRWIVPMERRIDYLSFSNGGKMTVPFETFLIFSTNLTPDKLGDEAFLRRIQYKMLLRSPDQNEFRAILCKFCESKHLEAPAALVDSYISKHYLKTGKPFRRCQPRDVISQAIDYITFRRLPYELTEELLDHAFRSCFSSTSDLTDA